MISTLELRRIIEESFRPLECQCTLVTGNSLQVRVTDPATGRVDLLVTGISTNTLVSPRAISELIAELRYDLATNKQKNLTGIAATRR
ncbi:MULTISPECIES: DUF1652 domain-containing protein [Pseudomonas]|uniref:DUF1652 domain-containing protein n=1 Tax=Pseudomonas TaxID=286 RepID=UPI000D364528|nr:MULTISPECIES: DUF1652 domain-containing protein [Pseudomonas]MBC8781685.1 DUF1652 domain-containing protein [Pseudomonas fluorescens]PTT24344.1 hypothetical protein DBR18_27740 [Pseudomonas sp. HMWF021]